MMNAHMLRQAVGWIVVLMATTTSMSSALATTLQLEFIDAGKPEEVVVKFHGQPDMILKEPWSMELPAIPADKWELRFRLVIPYDTIQTDDNPKEVEIPIRYTWHHAKSIPLLKIPVYILTAHQDPNNTFVTSFEKALGEKERTQGLFKARYAYMRMKQSDGILGRRILAAYMERAWDYINNNNLRYVSLSDDVVYLVDELLRTTDGKKKKKAQDRFKEDGTLGKLRYEPWDDLKLALKMPPMPQDENLRCLLIKFYLDKLTEKPNIQLAVTKVWGVTAPEWGRLESMAGKPPCKATKVHPN
jgi:hypothetical protein